MDALGNLGHIVPAPRALGTLVLPQDQHSHICRKVQTSALIVFSVLSVCVLVRGLHQLSQELPPASVTLENELTGFEAAVTSVVGAIMVTFSTCLGMGSYYRHKQHHS
jgi:hypothetical protein